MRRASAGAKSVVHIGLTAASAFLVPPKRDLKNHGVTMSELAQVSLGAAMRFKWEFITAGRQPGRLWNGFVLGLLVAGMMQFSGKTSANRNAEPWPTMLGAEMDNSHPSFLALQTRATATLERLVQAEGATAQPL